MKSKEEEEYEERVKARVLILKDLLEQGKIKLIEGSNVVKSLEAARFDSNGEPDLATIDGVVRSMALMAERFHYRTETKNAVSSLEIQNRYFQYIDSNFGHFYEKMVELRLSPHEVAYNIANSNNNIDFLNDNIELFINDILEFWNIHSEPAYIHAEDDYDSIKAVFGGDLFPSNEENIASKCGLYTDTIVLPCPFIRSKNMFARWKKNQRVYYLIKHALNVLQYKELALADTDKPIVVILPDKEMMSDFELEQVFKLADRDSLFHAEKIFDKKFESIEELIEYSKAFNTIEKVVKAIKAPERVLFDIDFKEPLNKQIENQLAGMTSQLTGINHPGILIASLGMGRMGVCNELLLKASKVRGVPLIDAPTSWQYFKWKLEYDTERTYSGEDFAQLHVVKGLEELSDTPLKWIGKIPPSGLIELRKSGAINEIREILGKGINELIEIDKYGFATTSQKVFNNLSLAINEHEVRIKELQNKKWKIAGKDIGSWLVMGSVEIAAACIGTPLFGVSAAILNQLIDAPKLKDIPKSIEKIKEINIEKNKANRSPVGLIFNYKK